MKLSPYAMKKRQALVRKAVRLYKQGMSTREVGKEVGKSHEWVASVMRRELSPIQ